MKTINLTKKQIEEIGEDLSMSAKCFYHFGTGKIKIFYPDESGDYSDCYDDEEIEHQDASEDDEYESDYDEVFCNKREYFEFDLMTSRESFQIMADFVETVSDTRLVNRLVYALNSRKPFRHFKDVVESSTYRQKWFDFESENRMAWVEKQINRHNQYASIRKQ